jgi:hypothetical protein
MVDISPSSRDLADRLSAWARGSQSHTDTDTDTVNRGDGVAIVVCEDPTSAAWLRDPGTGLLTEDSVVFLRSGRRGQALPSGPGHWLPFAGGTTEPGDEMEISREFWVQTADYVSLRYLGVAGPTVVRLLADADAEAYLEDVVQANATGVYPETLLHPVVELGDRCALSATTACTASGLGSRLHIDVDGNVRTSPAGRVLGTSGATAAELTVAAAACDTDVCVSPEVGAVLAGAEALGLHRYLAALDALRTMTLRIEAPWRVCGPGFSLLDDADGADDGGADEATASRDDFFVLVAPREQVLFDTRAHRAFRVDRAVAQVLEAVLRSPDEQGAVRRLERSRSYANPRVAIRTVGETFEARGVQLMAPLRQGMPS